MSDPDDGGGLARVAATARLLVACDFDGTLSPIVDVPDEARPDPAAVTALSRLAALPGTEAAIVSGRSRAALAELTGLTDSSIRLVGSHGAEFDAAPELSEESARRLAEVEAELRRLAPDFGGSIVEPKPTGVAFHYRLVPERLREAAARAAREGPGRRPGVIVREGHMVVELLVCRADKGRAIERLREETHASATLFVGDDRTDEDAFCRLGPRDLGVKVGPGETAATVRIEGQPDVAPLLERVYDLRRPRDG